MMFRHAALVFFFGAGLLATPVPALAQVQVKDPSVFDPIPAAQRAKLLERLHVVFELQKKEDWERLYEFVLPEDRPPSSEEYVRRMKAWTGHMKPTKFTPDSIGTRIYSPEGDIDTSHFGMYIIDGCGEYGWGWFKEKYETSITARLENGVWYFSDFLPDYEAVDGPLASCWKPNRKPKPNGSKKH